MEKIKTVAIGDRVTMILKFQNIQIKKTSANDDYASLIGFDTEDLIDVKIWSLSEEKKKILKNGEIYVASGMIKDYQGKKQFNVGDFRIAGDDEAEKDLFYEYAPLSETELQTGITEYVNRIGNKKLRDIVLTTIKKEVKAFFEYPAAVTIHHNYIGGLAYHVYSMLKVADGYLKIYPYLNGDLLYAGIILHDVGKIKELSGSKGVEYTKQGNLLGHISLGAAMIRDSCRELGWEDSEEAMALEHMILSHHGLREYGSPKEPAIPEAYLLFLLDYADSRMQSLGKAAANTEKGKFTEQLTVFDRRSFYIPDL